VKILYCWQMYEATVEGDSPMLSLRLTASARTGLGEHKFFVNNN